MEEVERLARERDFHNRRFADDSERTRRTQRFYDAIAYGFLLYKRRVQEESAGRSLLECGCGTDGLAFDMAASAQAVVGIDISEVAIAEADRIAAERRLPNVRFQLDNAEATSFAAAYFDVIAGSGIVHHLDIARSMHEFRRLLKEGGTAIFAEPLGHNPVLRWYRRRTPELRSVDEHPLLMSDLRAMARPFTSIRVTYFGLLAPLLGFVPQSPGPASGLTRIVWWLDRQLCRIPLLNRLAWYCVVELRA
ncbi:MAG TPA: methyltransferase domain-containing protein [Steroidobacteraceae bacterium]|nr:methyltransferase domain-containing protein [Steroidobacteraceae bacterium]